jgi:hypothetical protein
VPIVNPIIQLFWVMKVAILEPQCSGIPIKMNRAKILIPLHWRHGWYVTLRHRIPTAININWCPDNYSSLEDAELNSHSRLIVSAFLWTQSYKNICSFMSVRLYMRARLLLRRLWRRLSVVLGLTPESTAGRTLGAKIRQRSIRLSASGALSEWKL